jgi:hypothetical protein
MAEPRGGHVRVIVGACVLLLCPSPTHAQNNEPIYRSWFWEEDALTPRAAGIGGAYVAVADDASSVLLNPSGLVNLPIPGDLQVDRVRKKNEHLATGDKLIRKVHYAGSLGVHFAPRWAVGAAIVRPKVDEMFMGTRCASLPEGACNLSEQDKRNNPDPYTCTRLPDGSCDLASLSASFTTYVIAGAHRPTWLVKGLSVGVALGVQYVKADGISNRNDDTSDHSVMPHMHDNSTDDAFWYTAGALWRAGKFNIGASYRRGLRWRFTRALATTGAHIPDQLPSRNPPPTYTVTAPSRISLGVAWRPEFWNRSGRFLFAGELDKVSYGEIADAFSIEPGAAAFALGQSWEDVRSQYKATDYHLDSAVEWRLGSEVTFRSVFRSGHKIFRGIGLQLRGGFYNVKRGSVRYSSDPPGTEQAVFGALALRNRWSFGAALNKSIARIEWTRLTGGYRSVWLLGVTVRYPGFY